MDVVLSKKKAGRPLLFGNEIDKKVQDYLRMLQKKGGILNSVVIDEDEHLKCIDLENTEWACSLFLRIGFERRAATTGRWKIPDGAIKEAGLLFHHSIIDIVHRYQIPPPLIMNFDQTLDKKKMSKPLQSQGCCTGKHWRRHLVSHFQTVSYLCN